METNWTRRASPAHRHLNDCVMTVSNVARPLHILLKAAVPLVAACCMEALMKDKLLHVLFPEKSGATADGGEWLSGLGWSGLVGQRDCNNKPNTQHTNIDEKMLGFFLSLSKKMSSLWGFQEVWSMYVFPPLQS